MKHIEMRKRFLVQVWGQYNNGLYSEHDQRTDIWNDDKDALLIPDSGVYLYREVEDWKQPEVVHWMLRLPLEPDLELLIGKDYRKSQRGVEDDYDY